MYCDEINYLLDYNATKIAEHGSQDCINAPPNHRVLVPANMKDAPVQVASALRTGFAVAVWLSIVIHVVGVEVYVSPLHLISRKTSTIPFLIVRLH